MVENTYDVESWLVCCVLRETLWCGGDQQIQIVKYAVVIGIKHKPGFNWWVLFALKKHYVIIALVQNHSNNFGSSVYRQAEQQYHMDRCNCKKDEDCQVAFDIIENGMHPSTW